jgi:hypothetical protein
MSRRHRRCRCFSVSSLLIPERSLTPSRHPEGTRPSALGEGSLDVGMWGVKGRWAGLAL